MQFLANVPKGILYRHGPFSLGSFVNDCEVSEDLTYVVIKIKIFSLVYMPN